MSLLIKIWCDVMRLIRLRLGGGGGGGGRDSDSVRIINIRFGWVVDKYSVGGRVSIYPGH